jgi:hypothetical protein
MASRTAVTRVDPRWLSLRVTRALTDRPLNWVRVYSATGELIAEIDPVSRRRYPIPRAGSSGAAATTTRRRRPA